MMDKKAFIDDMIPGVGPEGECIEPRTIPAAEASRWSFVFKHKREPAAKLAHTCGNENCVNPAHLKEATDEYVIWLATNSDLSYQEIADRCGRSMFQVYRLAKPHLPAGRRRARRYEVNGEMLTADDISNRYTIPLPTVHARIRRGLRGAKLIHKLWAR